LTSTDVEFSISQWTSVATNTLTSDGNFTVVATNACNPGTPQQSYILQIH